MSQPDIFYTALKMTGILIVLLGGIYGALKIMKRFFYNPGFYRKSDHLINVLCVRHIGVKKQIALIEIPGSVLVVGISGERIQLLDKIVKEDAVANMLKEGTSS